VFTAVALARGTSRFATAAPVDRAAPAGDTGSLIIDVAPFAQVWIDDQSIAAGQAPLQLRLPVGRHQIRLTSDRLHQETPVSVTITTARAVVLDDAR
jgi:hypothetical protein